MDFSSFLTSLGTFFVIFVVLMLLFTWLSRKKPGKMVVYYPNRILKVIDPMVGELGRGQNPFAWIWEALSSTEDDVISMSGVDSAVYVNHWYLKSTFHHTRATEDCGHTFIRASSSKSQCLVLWSKGVLLLPDYNPASNIDLCIHLR